jgi:hypothetical protein
LAHTVKKIEREVLEEQKDTKHLSMRAASRRPGYDLNH